MPTNFVPEVTAFYVALLALFYLLLTVNVIRNRYRYQVGVGLGAKNEVALPVRVHGNFAEYTPLALLLLLVMELMLVPTLWLYVLGGAFTLGRLLHAIGLGGSAGTSFGRMAGTVLTMAYLLISVLLLLLLVF